MEAPCDQPWSHIQHIVVLMLENRSFDNVLGWLHEHTNPRDIRYVPPGFGPQFMGLQGQNLAVWAQPLITSQGATKLIPRKGTTTHVTEGVAYHNSPAADPNEKFAHVTQQLFGHANPKPGEVPQMLGFVQDYWSVIEEEYAQYSYADKLKMAAQVIETHTDQSAPVFAALGRAFGVSDWWHASVPTQTNPNRAFMACGTSLGQTDNEGDYDQSVFDTDTIWNRLDGRASWKVFFEARFPPLWGDNKDMPWTWHAFPRLQKICKADSFQRMTDFHQLARTGSLPWFSFIEPAWTLMGRKYHGIKTKGLHGLQGTECHPPGDIRPGEDLLAAVYASLIANPTAWASTLLVVTFDEHGGIWDHYPPGPAIAPDDHTQNFGFDRFGVRVPTLFISPWVDSNTVARAIPFSWDPMILTPYDHTSIPATLLKWQGLPNNTLGKRVQMAPTFESVLNRSTPRPQTDTVLGPPEARTARDPLHIGDRFRLRSLTANWAGYYVSSVHDLTTYPSAASGSGSAIPLRFTLGGDASGNPVIPPNQVLTHGSAVRLETLESDSIRIGPNNRAMTVKSKYFETDGVTACYYADRDQHDDTTYWHTWIVKIVKSATTGAPGVLGQPIGYGDVVTIELRNPSDPYTWLPGKLIPYTSVTPPGYYLTVAPDSAYDNPTIGFWMIER
jgi:phospholipase C